jgi:hypothetical protein
MGTSSENAACMTRNTELVVLGIAVLAALWTGGDVQVCRPRRQVRSRGVAVVPTAVQCSCWP